ncbi:hypothetical protein [Micromonospora sp. LOL_023]|uniref:hypothetical protein n=1 Tax=Micromonospora sp. LOL_023 TaxID=3345418 RepID=UPI003A8B49BC
MENMIEIGAIDDETMLLQSFANWFASTPDIRLTATAASVDEYLARQGAPTIVLLDLDPRPRRCSSMPDLITVC